MAVLNHSIEKQGVIALRIQGCHDKCPGVDKATERTILLI